MLSGPFADEAEAEENIDPRREAWVGQVDCVTDISYSPAGIS